DTSPSALDSRTTQPTDERRASDARVFYDFIVCGPYGLQYVIREQVGFDHGEHTIRGSLARKRRAGGIRTVRIGPELAAAAPGRSGWCEARGLDVGVRRRRVCGNTRPHLDSAAWRAALARRCETVDRIWGAHSGPCGHGQ